MSTLQETACRYLKYNRCLYIRTGNIHNIYWVTQKLPQICTVILRISIGKVAWFAVYICGNIWTTQYADSRGIFRQWSLSGFYSTCSSSSHSPQPIKPCLYKYMVIRGSHFSNLIIDIRFHLDNLSDYFPMRKIRPCTNLTLIVLGHIEPCDTEILVVHIMVYEMFRDNHYLYTVVLYLDF